MTIITVASLKKSGACSFGIEFFKEHYPSGRVPLDDLIQHAKLYKKQLGLSKEAQAYLGWLAIFINDNVDLVSRMELLNLSDDYSYYCYDLVDEHKVSLYDFQHINVPEYLQHIEKEILKYVKDFTHS